MMSTGCEVYQLSPQERFSPRAIAPLPVLPPKILLYSHDTAGLGNIRRTLLLSETLQAQYPQAAILIVTGSPMIHAFRLPDGVDYIKLPCLDRIDADRYTPRYLSACATEITHTRKTILSHAVLGFQPDLMIVDKRPCGIDGELLETLKMLRRRRLPTKLVLGVRDILDDPEQTRPALQKNGYFDTIREYYDEVWIYGAQKIFDATTAYGFPAEVIRKTYYCGYLKRPTIASPRKDGPPHVLVTTGGGGDGSDTIEAYLEGLISLPRRFALQTTIIFGPQMPTSRRAAILERFGYLTDVTFLDFAADLTRHYAEADVVVSMAGYNTVCELLSFERRAVLVPRAEPVREQLIRARLFEAEGYFSIVEPRELTPDTLLSKVLAALEQGASITVPLDMEGLPRIRKRIHSLLSRRER
jgi:predicted glycosyltransferase